MIFAEGYDLSNRSLSVVWTILIVFFYYSSTI